MNSFANLKVGTKKPSSQTVLVVGKKYNLRDCLARQSANPDIIGSNKQFLMEVILMDNTTNYNINDIPQEIRGFLDELLRGANMTSLDEKMHDEMVVELYTRLDDYMIGTITEKLPKEKLEEFTKMAEAGKNRDELQEYLKNNIPDTTEVFANAMIDFRSLYLGSVDNARDAQASGSDTHKPETSVPQTEDTKGGIN